MHSPPDSDEGIHVDIWASKSIF